MICQTKGSGTVRYGPNLVTVINYFLGASPVRYGPRDRTVRYMSFRLDRAAETTLLYLFAGSPLKAAPLLIFLENRGIEEHKCLFTTSADDFGSVGAESRWRPRSGGIEELRRSSRSVQERRGGVAPSCLERRVSFQVAEEDVGDL